MTDTTATGNMAATGDISIRVTIICFLIVMVDGYDSLVVAFIAPAISAHWNLDPHSLGALFAATYVGAIIGALSMGPLSDRFGRKPLLIVALTLATVATGACATAASLDQLRLFRFLAGIGLGGAMPALAAMTGEHAPPEKRSGRVTLMMLGFPAGAVFGGALTAALLHVGWQNIFWGAAFGCAFAAALGLLLPETYRKASRTDTRALATRLTSTFTEQFEDGRLWPAIALWTALFCLMMLIYFLVNWSPSILVAAGAPPNIAALAGVFVNLGGIIGAIGLAPLIDRFGPYRPVAILIGAGTIAVALLGQNIHSLTFTMVLLFVAGVAVMGGQLNFPAMTVDLFPRHVRGAGGGWTVGVGRIGSIVGPLLGGALIGMGLGNDTLFLAAAIPALVACLTLFAAIRLRRRLKSVVER
jgi:AAHS family 4-hydroxybenzoate transporter-like MFS transporter